MKRVFGGCAETLTCLHGSPVGRGSAMSCQSLSLAPADAQPLSTFHRTVHFSTDGESKSLECAMECPREIEIDNRGLPSWCGNDKMTRSAPAACGGELGGTQGEGEGGARFPRLEECAHFHYGRVRLGGLTVKAQPDTLPPHNNEEDAGWVTVSVHPHSEDRDAMVYEESDRSMGGMMAGEEDSNSNHWLLTRSAENFKMLDTMLHRCIYDRKVSGLPDLSVGVDEAWTRSAEAYTSLITDYLHHFSIIADDSINCGPILNWFQMDNKGHRLLVASEDTNSINTPAVAAAYSVRRYVSQARDEISFEVGDMISVIDMPGPSESTWWRGKRGFKVGFFPQQCVAVIGDKVPRNMKEPPPIVGSVAVAPIKPVLRKHGKLISLFRSFILSRPSRRSLRQQGILKERVFGCDLGEHLLNSGHEVPMVLSCCAKIIEQYGCVDGIYRLSGASSTTQRLRIAFDEEKLPPLDQAPSDVHAVASLLKMYFRELPNPLCTYQLYSCFVNAVQGTPNPDAEGENCHPRRLDDAEKLLRMRETVVKLPPPHYRTLAFLMRHLHHMSLLGSSTGMTARNMAIVWAPNLLSSPIQQHALQGVAVQAVVTEFLICYADLIFSDDQSQLCQTNISNVGSALDQPDSLTSCSDFNDGQSIKRPKSLPLQTPTKLLSLEEARSKQQLLRPSVSREPHYIEVGSGPNSLPRYHTIIQLPSGSAKRGLKRSPSGWRGLFFRASKHRPRATSSSSGPVAASSVPTHIPTIDLTTPVGVVVDDIVNCKEKDPSMTVEDSRTARSCESLLSDGDSLPPLSTQPEKLSANHHNRSVSCDSYFEASLAEMAGMRLRLSSQEREMDIFSEDDTTKQMWNKDAASSADTSVEPSPTKLPRTTISVVPSPLPDNRKRTKLEDQLSDLLYIDCSTPEHRTKATESGQTSHNSPSNEGEAKRVCKETSDGSNEGSLATTPQSLAVKVKMRDRGSPRRSSKSSSRHSHSGTPPSPKTCVFPQRHSTLIQVDWPHSDNLQPTSLNCYAYTQLQSDSECSLPVGESRDSLAKRLIESKESLMSRSNETDGSSVLNVEGVNVVNPTINESKINKMSTELLSQTNCETVKEEKEEMLVDNRNSGHFNVDWSDGMMDSSMERSTISSDLDKSFDGKKYSSDKVSDYEGFDMTRKSLISSCDEDDSSKKSEDTKIRGKCENKKRNVTVTPSEENCSNVMIDSLEESLSPVNISYQNLNRLSNLSNDSPKTETSKESTPTASPLKDQERTEEIYECFSFSRPSYIHLASSSSNTPGSPPLAKSPIKSTISITFKSPTKEEYNSFHSPNSMSDQKLIDDKAYEHVEIIAEDATVPVNYDADLPTQEACQPNRNSHDLILLDTPVEEKVMCVQSESNDSLSSDLDIYNQVKFFRQSIHEVNSLILESDNEQANDSTSNQNQQQCGWYENVCFDNVASENPLSPHHAYENLVMPNLKTENKTQEKHSPTLSLCIDRSLNIAKPNDCVKKNSYENYTIPASGQKDKSPTTPDSVEMRRSGVKLSLDDINKENNADNGNLVTTPEDKSKSRKSTNVRQLANKFESPTENIGPFSFDRYSKSSVSPSERNKAVSLCEAKNSPNPKMTSSGYTNSNKFSKNYSNTRSLDENAFIKEFGKQKESMMIKNDDVASAEDKRKSFEVEKIKTQPKKLPDLNLNLQCDNTIYSNRGSLSLSLNDDHTEYDMSDSKYAHSVEHCASVTPTTENKISLVQARLSPKRNQRQKNAIFTETPRDLSETLSTSEMSLDQDRKSKLSRERIERYKEERRLFLREKYSPHSFRGVGDLQLSYKSSKCKNDEYEDISFDGVELRNPSKVLERRNTADAAQRVKYSNVLSTNKFISDDTNDDKTCESDKLRSKNSVIEESPIKVTYMQKKFSVPEPNVSNNKIHVPSAGEIDQKDKNSGTLTKPKSLNLSTSSSDAAASDFGSPRKEKRSPSFNIRDMAAKFEQRSHSSS